MNISANKKALLREHFLQELRKVKEVSALSNAAIAKRLGVGRPYLSQIASDASKTPSQKLLDKIQALRSELSSEQGVGAQSGAPLAEMRIGAVVVQYDPRRDGSMEEAGRQLRATITALFQAGGKQSEVFEKIVAEALRGLGGDSPAGPKTSSSDE